MKPFHELVEAARARRIAARQQEEARMAEEQAEEQAVVEAYWKEQCAAFQSLLDQHMSPEVQQALGIQIIGDRERDRALAVIHQPDILEPTERVTLRYHRSSRTWEIWYQSDQEIASSDTYHSTLNGAVLEDALVLWLADHTARRAAREEKAQHELLLAEERAFRAEERRRGIEAQHAACWDKVIAVITPIEATQWRWPLNKLDEPVAIKLFHWSWPTGPGRFGNGWSLQLVPRGSELVLQSERRRSTLVLHIVPGAIFYPVECHTFSSVAELPVELREPVVVRVVGVRARDRLAGELEDLGDPPAQARSIELGISDWLIEDPDASLDVRIGEQPLAWVRSAINIFNRAAEDS